MSKNTDDNKMVTVCSSCFMASCWLGEFMCEDSIVSGTVEKTVKELKELGFEDPGYWDDESHKEHFTSWCDGLEDK